VEMGAWVARTRREGTWIEVAMRYICVLYLG
jgi:hypothetical protein